MVVLDHDAMWGLQLALTLFRVAKQPVRRVLKSSSHLRRVFRKVRPEGCKANFLATLLLAAYVRLRVLARPNQHDCQARYLCAAMPLSLGSTGGHLLSDRVLQAI